jgi:predicted DCC family thiol-disulfide oxidoreductase YuxK
MPTEAAKPGGASQFLSDRLPGDVGVPLVGLNGLSKTETRPKPDPVLLYDGECGLCQWLVRLLLWLDRRGRLRFAPLQGPAAQGYLRQQGLPVSDFESMVLAPDWARGDAPTALRRTEAVMAALREVGGIGSVIAVLFRLVPGVWRDAGYRRVARWRRKLFGAARAGALARPEWSGRFLD